LILIPSWKLFYDKLINMSFKSFIKPVTFPLLISSFIYLIFYSLSLNGAFYQIVFTLLLAILLFIYAYFNSEDFKIQITKFRK